MKIVKIIASIFILLSLSACRDANIYKLQNVDGSNANAAYPYIAKERDSSIQKDLVGDPMEAYFVSDEYKTKANIKSNNPIYSKDSFIKGTYPLDNEELDCKTARVIVIQFKEDIDVNCLYNKEKPAITIIYPSHGKDITDGYNFTYDCVTQKLLITNKNAMEGFGSANGREIIINGDNLRTAEIQDVDTTYEDGRTEHIEGQRSRQLSGTYSFMFYTSER